MKSYQIIPHTADVRLKVEAGTLPKLFEVAMEGMSSIIKTTKQQNNKATKQQSIKDQALKIKKTVEIQSTDKTTLLIDFLNEVLYRSHTNKEVYKEVKFLEFSETSLKAEIFGQKVDEFDEDVKAATYHEAEIIKNKKGNFETVVVFDV